MVAILEHQKPALTINSLIFGLAFDFHNTINTFNTNVLPEIKAFIEDKTAEEQLLEEDKQGLNHYKQILKRMRTGKKLAKFAQTLKTPAHVQETVHYANLYFLKIDSLLQSIELLLQDTTEYLMKDTKLMQNIEKARKGEGKRISFETAEEMDNFFRKQTA